MASTNNQSSKGPGRAYREGPGRGLYPVKSKLMHYPAIHSR